MLTQESKDFIKANIKLSVVGAVFIANKTGATPEQLEIQELVSDSLHEAFEELKDNAPDMHDLIDAGQLVITTGGKAFGSPRAQELCKNLNEGIDAGQKGEYFKMFGEGLELIGDVKAVARENKAKKNK